MTVPLTGWWYGNWSRNITLTDIIVDTDDVTTQIDPQDGAVRLQVTSAGGSSQTISGSLFMSGFECFDNGSIQGSWSGSNVGITTFSEPALVDSNVASIAVTVAGAGYTQNTTTVTLTAPSLTEGVQATATATVSADGEITGFVVTEPGSGYTVAPGVNISDTGGGAGAVATATLADEEDVSTTRLSLSGHQTKSGQLKFQYTVASGECEAKRGSITLSKSD